MIEIGGDKADVVFCGCNSEYNRSALFLIITLKQTPQVYSTSTYL